MSLIIASFSKSINKEVAIAEMIAGINVTLFYVFQHKVILFVSDWKYLQDWRSNWFFGIKPNAFGAIGALFNFTIAFLVSRVTAETPESVKDLVEDVRVPSGAEQSQVHSSAFISKSPFGGFYDPLTSQ